MTQLLRLLPLVLVLAAAVPVPAAPVPDEAALKARVERYLVDYFKLGPRDSVTVDEVWDAAAVQQWGLAVTKVQGGKSESLVYMLSKDLTRLSLGRVLDFGEDRRARNRARLDLTGAPARGPADAPVTIVAFCEFQCSDCRALVAALKRVLPAYEGRVRYVFKSFPILDRHEWAEAAALGVYCARDQEPEAFWAFHDALFEGQGDVTTANVREKLQELARVQGLDAARLGRCVDEKTFLPVVVRDVYDARRVGARGTPTLLVNGRFVFDEGARDDDFRKLIDEALAR